MNFLDTIKINKVKRSLFNLDHENHLTCNMAELIPVMRYDGLPSDKVKCDHQYLIKLHPLIAPVMARVNSYIHNFKVPNRILWKEWKEFITGGKDGKTRPVYPRMVVTASSFRSMSQEYHKFFKPGSLYDFLGFPTFDPMQHTGDSDNFKIEINLLPFLAYYKIWQLYFADENLTDFTLDEDFMLESRLYDPIQDEDLFVALFTKRNRCWEKDYFTAALPFPQRGEDVLLPLNGSAPINATATSKGIFNSQGQQITGSGEVDYYGLEHYGLFGAVGQRGNIESSVTGTADLSQASASTINELRRAFALQRWLETNARAGYRYIDFLKAHFNVTSSDARLQRPEFLGGGKQPVMIGEVLQTSETASTPQGTMAGKGISIGVNNGFKTFCEEHCIIISLLSVIPRSAYSQGLSRMDTKFEREDYAYPEFAHLGEQEVKQQELYFSGNENDDIQTFGYMPRYSEYKLINSSYHGDMRFDAPASLNFWHLGRQFQNSPGLNQDFVTCSPEDVKRIFAVTDTSYDHLIIQVYNKLRAVRPLPYYGTPH